MMPESSWRPPDSFPDISGARWWSLDVESKDPHLSELGPGFIRGDAFIVGVAISCDGFSGYYPVRHAQGSNLAPNAVFDWLSDQAKYFRGELYGANLLYDEEGLWHDGVILHDDVQRRDVQVVEPLLDEETAEGYSLEVLSRKYLGVGKDEVLLQEAASRYTKGYKDKRARRPIPFDPKKELWLLDPAYVGAYAEGDVDRPRRIYEKQIKQIEDENLQGILKLESSLIPILLRMRILGVAIDLGQAEKLKELLTREIDKYSLAIKNLVGFDPNVDSGPDMTRAYNIIHLKYPEFHIDQQLKFTSKGNASFVADWYAAQADPLSRAVIRKKKLMTLRDDFVVGDILKSHVNGRIHAQFHQLRQDDRGTRSGRFSSTNPNLQQVPARHDGCEPDCPSHCVAHIWGKEDPNWSQEVRKLFVADEGKRFQKSDESQQELRLLVHLANRCKLQGIGKVVEEYRKNPKTDYHNVVQKLVTETCGKNYKRRYIKDANFGLVYGMGFVKLCLKLKLSPAEASEFLAAYHGAIPFAKPLATLVASTVATRGFLSTLLERRRRFNLWEPIPESKEERTIRYRGLPLAEAQVRWPGRRLQRFGTHKGLNAWIQGSAADMVKEAMRILYYECGRIVAHLQVHDELCHSVGDMAESRTIKRVMEQCVPLDIPMLCDARLGPNWGSCKEEVLLEEAA